ncbi:LIM homeobox transcription factor 1-beta-like isoform X1 [Betta splendens]|uniref:LIM/homeobox protein Lhx9 n=1 Tax=Betta splendens TaxID=158456 RepID=A0A9W2Y4C2_BETSP|nr:LIM homeobox transcription factor 1-beta-like isoform X1 [Betta splendens]
MMAPDDGSLEDLLYGSGLGDEDGTAAADSVSTMEHLLRPPSPQEVMEDGASSLLRAVSEPVCRGSTLPSAGGVWLVTCSVCVLPVSIVSEALEAQLIRRCLLELYMSLDVMISGFILQPPLTRLLSITAACGRLRPGAAGVCRLWAAGVRALLPAGCRPGVAQRLPALQPVPVRAADAALALLQGREHLLPAGLLQVSWVTSWVVSARSIVFFVPLSRMFGGGQCARCCQPIPASALVMRSGELTFHPQCFSCQECEVKLVPGNLYCMQGQNLYCQAHYHGDESIPPSTDPQPRTSLTEGQVQVSAEGEDSVSSPEPRLDDRPVAGRTRRRTKRIRTCFRSEQLRALESYFAQKHNPDGKDWTCLAYKTGLPKRVLQVWFQNARAKLRRSLTADESQVNSPSAPSRGVTMATSPPPPACSPLDRSSPFPSSTIDHLQLSLLTNPLSDAPQLLQRPDCFLDCSSQNASCCLSPLEAYGDAAGGAESYQPRYC